MGFAGYSFSHNHGSQTQRYGGKQCLLLGFINACCYDFWLFHAASYVYGALGISMIVISSMVSQAVSWIMKYVQYMGV